MNSPSTSHRPATSLRSFKSLVRSRTQTFAHREPFVPRSQIDALKTEKHAGDIHSEMKIETGKADLSRTTSTPIEIASDDAETLTLNQSDATSPTRSIFPSKSSSRPTLRQRRFSRSMQSLSREFKFDGGESSLSSGNLHKTFRKWQAPRDSYIEIDSDPDDCPEDFQVVVAVIATVTAKPVLTPLVTPKQSAHFQHSDFPELPTNISAISAANFPEFYTSTSTLPVVSSQDGAGSVETGKLDDGPMENISTSAELKSPKSPSDKSSFGSSADIGLNRSTGPSLSSSIGPSSDNSCGISLRGGPTPSTALAVKSPVKDPCLPLSIQPNGFSSPSYPKLIRTPIHATHIRSEIPRRGSEGVLPKLPTRPKRSGTLPSRNFTKDSPLAPATDTLACPWEVEESQELQPFIKTVDQTNTTDCNKSISSRHKYRPLKEKIGASSFFRKLAHKISSPNKYYNRSDSPAPIER
ncbi:uncharacterized protein MELLADRAFT_70739 [Melampsora larici-populina 98AG31]|uniref:Uncharacterized protein n=1 Tax=Melampsora larici-populina (strain 98AG31 / pathotype 3-4-7) TaxID=747676 RepID=F4R7C3_MELLP|nr:uncharacterized protein MELLADRAFT_70739 [Melampsora larici-populina 98AG31]EGG11810.1 hypothetical protein MELLADRAFT_70739 [Melampsora larici-populina 98AG31]